MNTLGIPTPERYLAQIVVNELITKNFMSTDIDFVKAIDTLENRFKFLTETKEMVLDMLIEN